MTDIIDYSGLTGIVVTPEDPTYMEARQVYNRAIQRFPKVIVYCRSICDVRNAVLWARVNGVCIRIRSGGHNYEGYSIGNGVLVIDLSMLNDISLDRRSRTVTLGGGVKNAAAYAALAQAGLPFAGGSCPTVGASGYAMGGGWNFFCRYWGLGCDWLRAIRMVDYNGNVLIADAHQNTDLFWACRGGGDGNFGVIVSMTFELPPTPGRLTYFTIYRPHVSPADQINFLDTWQRWLPGMDNRMTLRPSLYRNAEEGLAVYSRGLFFGIPMEAERLLRPLIQSAGLTLETRYVPFDQAVELIGSVYPASEMFQSTGRFAGPPLSQNDIRAIVSLLEIIPDGLELIEIGLFAFGGMVRRVPSEATAFFYRQSPYVIGMQAVWTDPAFAPQGRAWVRRAFNTIAPVTVGSFVNFPYDGLVHYEKAYYGGNVPRLRAVKRLYDPKNVFNYPQSIRG